MFFDPTKRTYKKFHGHLPHWHQDEKIQFVTFRLVDSISYTKRQELLSLVEEYTQTHPKPWNADTKKEFNRYIGPMFERYLHNGFGCCALSRPDCRDILKEALWHGDGIDYLLYAYVIMPNHVHILIQPLDDQKLEKIMQSIKRYSSFSINKLLARSGPLWMRESFDRIVRSENDYWDKVTYIETNPANLKEGTFEVFVRPVDFDD